MGHRPGCALGRRALLVALLALGQVLAGLGALWSNRWGQWLLTDAGFLALYLSAMALLALPDEARGQWLWHLSWIGLC